MILLGFCGVILSCSVLLGLVKLMCFLLCFMWMLSVVFGVMLWSSRMGCLSGLRELMSSCILFDLVI